MEILLFILGMITGGMLGVMLMAMLQVNRDKKENY